MWRENVNNKIVEEVRIARKWGQNNNQGVFLL